MDYAYDTETTGLDLWCGKEMFSYSIASETSYDKPYVHRLDGGARGVENTRLLSNFWAAKDVVKIMHNAKFDLIATENKLGRPLADISEFRDTRIESHLLQNDHRNHRLKELCWELAGFPKDDEDKVKIYAGGNDPNYAKVPEPIMDEYQAKDVQRTLLLDSFFWPKIKADPKLLKEFNMEMDLVRATLAMERRGMMLHVPRCKALINNLRQDVEGVLKEIEDFAGERINPEQPGPLHWLLFDKAGLPILKRTEKTGKPSTKKEILLELRASHSHPVLEMLLKYRAWTDGIDSLESYLRYADSNDIIHPNIMTCGAITGRESCSHPNLQNVQKEGVLLNIYPIPARTVFCPRPGFVNFHIDYAGIEMRLLVFYSRERRLLEIIRRGGDVHEPATIVFYGDRYHNGDKALRKMLRGAAKNMNFAIPYGGSGVLVAHGLGIPVSEGVRKLNDYKREFPDLAGLNNRVASEVKRLGKVITAFGRPLRVPRGDVWMGLNYLIQGTAAGILKTAQPRVRRVLERMTGGEVQMLLPIHDELVIEFPRDRLSEAPAVFKAVREVMIDFPEFDLPLEIEVEVATYDWAHKRSYKFMEEAA